MSHASSPDARIDRLGMDPEYVQLAAIVAARIKRGDWAPGQRLPTERVLADDYQLSSKTVRKAMRVLAADGLVVSVTGRGHFVAGTG